MTQESLSFVRRFSASLVALLAFVGAPALAEAQEGGATFSPPTAGPAQDAQAETGAAFRERFAQAKQAFLAGDFAAAARGFESVARQAPDPELRARAAELGGIATTWWSRRMTLQPMRLAPGGMPEVAEARKDERTIDELAILYTNTVVWGAGFGITVGLATDGNASAYFLPSIGMAGLGAGAVALLDRKVGPLPYGVPNSITTGLYVGLEAGLSASLALALHPKTNIEAEAVSALTWGAATGGALIGGLIGTTVPVTPGRASFVGTGSLWGGTITGLVAAGVMPYEGDDNTHIPFIASFAGTAAGALTTGLLAGRVSPSIARVRFLDLGGIGGGLVFGGLYASIASGSNGEIETRPFFLLTAAGMATGMGIAAWATSGMERDEPRRAAVPSAMARVTPFLTPLPRGGASFGFGGAF